MDLAQTAEPCEKALSMSMLASGGVILLLISSHLEPGRSMLVAYRKVCCSRPRLLLKTSVVTDDAERTVALKNLI